MLRYKEKSRLFKYISEFGGKYRYKVLRNLGYILSDPQKWFDHTLDHTSSTQWPQTCTEAAKKCYSYTENGADEEREHRLPTLQKAMGRSGNAYSLQ